MHLASVIKSSRCGINHRTSLCIRTFRFNVDDCQEYLREPHTSSTDRRKTDDASEARTSSRKSQQKGQKLGSKSHPPGDRATTPHHQQSESRINTDVNIQMIGNSLFKQIFGNDLGKPHEAINIKQAQDELKKFNLWKDVELAEDVDLKLPKLEGKNIEEHFWSIGNAQSAPYKKLLTDFVACPLPAQPKSWLCNEGWTRYIDGSAPESVPCPQEDVLVFDVEVCMQLGQAPTLATAVSKSAWYGWVSPTLLQTSQPVPMQRYTPEMFVTMESKGFDKNRPRIVVGHNVAYDRARIREQYSVVNSALRFIDTMSMHVCIGGITSYQRAMLKTKTGLEDEDWREYSSLNSLKEVFKLYCKGELSKESRNIFVEGSIGDVRENFAEVMKYCALDVLATFQVLQKMVPLFFDRFPHPVTFAGMLEMSTAFLPINSNWDRYILDSDQTFDDLESECKFLLSRKADNMCRLSHDDAYKNDLWMWSEDWTTQELALTKSKTKKSTEVIVEDFQEEAEEESDGLEETFKELFKTDKLPKRRPHLPGYPAWYRKLCEKAVDDDWIPGPQLVSTSVKIAPKILNLTWQGYPLHHIKENGWGILVAEPTAEVDSPSVPYGKLKEITIAKLPPDSDEKPIAGIQNDVDEFNAKEDYWSKQGKRKSQGVMGAWTENMVDNCCHFIKLPHKDGAENNVGNPLAKDFVKKFSTSVLAGADAAATRVLEIGKMLSYWRNNRERIKGQLAVWHSTGMGVILPQVVVCGTLTRRAMEATWMTASNAQADRVGSELRSMVQAPPGYHIVGADVDSQELWLASVIGDSAAAGLHGCTPLGWMTLSGSKVSGTDMHSVTAAAAGISRDHAKVINYARIYGAGVRFAHRLLKQFNPGMSDHEAKEKAAKMFLLTKGRKEFHLKAKFIDQLPYVPHVATSYGASRIAKLVGKPVSEVFEPARWTGGTESVMFNRLEQVACGLHPRTPFLSAQLSRAVEPRHADDDSFMTTRINWVVQSGAVDFLHLMLVSLRWLSQGKMRYCLSFHDEVRYLVPSDLRYEAALALHITNLLTRAFCARRLGIHDLPLPVAFFSSVDVDKVLRKESKDDCITPSNPHGLEKGYGMPFGESLDIRETISRCGGVMSKLQKKNRNVVSNKKKTRVLGSAGSEATPRK